MITDFKITNITTSTRVFLDAPYRDGYENIKTALLPRRITYAFWRISIHDRLVDFSQRFIQCLTGIVLIIPGVNILADVALRFFFADSALKVLEPLCLEETLVTSATIINKILPRLLDFLDENGMNNSSIYYWNAWDNGAPIPLLAIPGSPFTPIPIRDTEYFSIKFNNQILNTAISGNEDCENDFYMALKQKIINSGLLPNRQICLL